MAKRTEGMLIPNLRKAQNVNGNPMKATTHIFAIAILLLFISCRQANEKKTVAANHSDTKTFVDKKEEERLEKRKQIDEQEKLDSINDDKVLSEAIKIVEQRKGQDRYKMSYVSTMPDSSYQVDVDIKSDFYFSNELPNLIIRRTTPSSIYIDIFLKKNQLYQKILFHKQWALEYTSDTIRDINGDGLKDFVVNWYGRTGCCLKAFSNVYLLRSDKKSFSNSFEFINPTFSPKEQIVRGVCYGHPGETEMYKYKWNKEAVDTIEYIYYEKNGKGEKTGKFIISNNLPYSDNHKVLKRLSFMPAEYRKIEGYDWFTDNLTL
ncbi:XAC2610-related protein [Pinibacter soli]|uniref:VCBS repeat-containing protein n=1 Tax=Pinibacter soli TaxID=3044211 RepID=A0ABT6RJI4_9BACT|nr:hypothetical protein [Pinibacter soli]MDI3322729.1 hypothetical protein [Pinibacter soli]